jgi:hypothetical protein
VHMLYLHKPIFTWNPTKQTNSNALPLATILAGSEISKH